MQPGDRRRVVEIEQVGDIAVFRLTRPDLVEEATIQRLGQDLARLIEERGYTRVVIDLGTVQRMSSAMFGQLLALWRQARAAGGRLVLCSTRPGSCRSAADHPPLDRSHSHL